MAFIPSGLLSPEHLPGFFLVLFILAAGAGLMALRILATQPERPKGREQIGVVEIMLGPLRDSNFRRLLAYGCWWMLAVGIGAPFWQPFMITKLHMSLVDIQIYGLASTLASLAVLRAWGKLIDRLGNKAMMRVAIILGGVNPLVWVFVTPQHHRVIYLEAVTSGIMWAGAGIISMNFVLAIAPEGKRQIYSGMFGAATGLAVMTTMFLSGLLLPPSLCVLGRRLEPEQALFAVTGILRWTTLIPLAWIAEPVSTQARGSPSVCVAICQGACRVDRGAPCASDVAVEPRIGRGDAVVAQDHRIGSLEFDATAVAHRSIRPNLAKLAHPRSGYQHSTARLARNRNASFVNDVAVRQRHGARLGLVHGVGQLGIRAGGARHGIGATRCAGRGVRRQSTLSHWPQSPIDRHADFAVDGAVDQYGSARRQHDITGADTAVVRHRPADQEHRTPVERPVVDDRAAPAREAQVVVEEVAVADVEAPRPPGRPHQPEPTP